jgi:hypothetical protein
MSYELVDKLTEVGMRIINHNIAKADGHTSVHTYIMIPRYVKFIDGVIAAIEDQVSEKIDVNSAKIFLVIDNEHTSTVIIQCDGKGEVASVTVQYRDG